MSFQHNQVQLTGRVAADPELYFTTDGTPKVSLVLLQDRSARQSDTTPERFYLVAWAAIGRRLYDTLRQNDRLFIQGRLRTRSFTREGVLQHRTEIHLEHFVLLKSPRSTQRLRQRRNPAGVAEKPTIQR